ncbi:ABC transporter permease [Pelagibius marinus]|uniref:ABC transporter permease n=1 Tax=Pelagibius marinus TaxID=2762760 RepID=UPI001872A3B8|nr:ABC transporter permease [Pelagibius marinus]
MTGVGGSPEAEGAAVGAAAPVLAFRAWRPLSFRRFNWRGLWTVYYGYGLFRFLRFGLETLAGPLVSSMLFLLVFVVGQRSLGEMLPGVGLKEFIAPGVALYALAYTAFQNSAAMIVLDKMEGTIADVQMAPLSALEVIAGFVLSAATCGLMSGALVALGTAVFVDYSYFDVTFVLGFAVLAALLFALLGTIAGLWAERWDHYGAVEGFLIVPLGLLSGTFFSVERLPEAFRDWIYFNPVFYAVDGFRAGFIGQAETSLALGAGLLAALNLTLAVLAWRLFAAGYKIRP